MERITKRIGEKYACYAICEKECPDGIYADNAACMCTASKMAMKRLLEYEDTGLTPEQIVEQTNGGWIPVEERLPEGEVNPVSQDFYEYQVTAEFGNVKDVRHYKYGKGHWWHGPGIVDQYVIAWKERPEPYRPEVTKP